MRPSPGLDESYCAMLFAGAQPSTVEAFKHKQSFKHYLASLRSQAASLTTPSFDTTVHTYKSSLVAADTLLQQLAAKHIRADDRTFLPVVDATQLSIDQLVEDRGVILKRKWATM